jgi:alkanesulfonate monooxygenase SsuD/methylene tetrahydromethanopterin reductase-like flavin-dependent oxidoreductase (luciferase family)
MMLAAAAAAVTTHMRVGSDIVVLPLHHPVAVAEEAALLDVMSGGRAILGVGLGSAKNEFEGFGVPWDDRTAVYDGSTSVVRDLLAGNTVDVDVPPYTGVGARVRPAPVNPEGVPLWIGALYDRGVRRAAVEGDAWVMPPILRTPDLAKKKLKYDEARAEGGLPPAGERPLRRDAFVAETDDEAWTLFLPAVRYLFGTVWRAFDPTYPDHDTDAALRAWGEDLFLVGSPETVAERALGLAAELDVTEYLLRFDVPEISDGAIDACLDGLGEVVRILGTRSLNAAEPAADMENA